MNKNENYYDIVYPFIQVKSILGNSNPSKYIYNYLKHLSAKTCVLEDKYIDKDFLIDYSKFYARSSDIDEKFTKRLHFFSECFYKKDLKHFLLNKDKNDKNIQKKLNKSYLGFVVIKPVYDSEKNPLIGRTILQTYQTKTNGKYRIYLKGKHNVSFFGIPLVIKSLPFQTQDIAVGACASTACWISLHPLADLFGIKNNSLFEVTESSTSFPSLERNFPSHNLTLFQIKNYFNSIRLETEMIDVTKIKNIMI